MVAAVCFAVAVLITASIGGVAAAGSGGVYAELELPAWAPPSWLFSPVWIALYVLIAVAGWSVWRVAGLGGAKVFFTAYVLQLVLNAAWPPLFFALGLYGVALIEIVLLDVVVVAAIVLAWRHSRVAALLLVPYLAWALFASALTLAIWLLN